MPGLLKEKPLLNQNFRDILFAFLDEEVEFIVVGGFAVAFHGHPRSTGDIDLWIRCSAENASRVWKALREFGAPLFDLTLEDLQTPGMVFQMGVVPSRIDVIMEIEGVIFDDAWKEHLIIDVEGMKVPVIGKRQLLVNKKAVARPKDQIDILWLESEEKD